MFSLVDALRGCAEQIYPWDMRTYGLWLRLMRSDGLLFVLVVHLRKLCSV